VDGGGVEEGNGSKIKKLFEDKYAKTSVAIGVSVPPAPPCIVRVDRCDHPGVELRANRKSISHRYHFFKVAFVWELTQEAIYLPLGCLQGGSRWKDLEA
jgi:hypothetical protein